MRFNREKSQPENGLSAMRFSVAEISTAIGLICQNKLFFNVKSRPI